MLKGKYICQAIYIYLGILCVYLYIHLYTLSNRLHCAHSFNYLCQNTCQTYFYAKFLGVLMKINYYDEKCVKAIVTWKLDYCKTLPRRTVNKVNYPAACMWGGGRVGRRWTSNLSHFTGQRGCQRPVGIWYNPCCHCHPCVTRRYFIVFICR